MNWKTCCPFAIALILSAACRTGRAQTLDPGKEDQFLRASLFHNRTSGQLIGGISGRMQFNLQPQPGKGDKVRNAQQVVRYVTFGVIEFDYGSISKKRVTPTGEVPENEGDASSNAGKAALLYGRSFGRGGVDSRSLMGLEGGIEHKRFRKREVIGADTVFREEGGSASPFGGLFGRFHRSHLFGGRKGNADSMNEFTWLLEARILSSQSLLPSSEKRRRTFADPKATLWVSLIPVIPSQGEVELPLYHRVLFRMSGALSHSLGARVGDRANWDTSLTYFFQKSFGVELRHFDGYFAHNLRDRKVATSLNLILKL